jgi:hypothetical protein
MNTTTTTRPAVNSLAQRMLGSAQSALGNAHTAILAQAGVSEEPRHFYEAAAQVRAMIDSLAGLVDDTESPDGFAARELDFISRVPSVLPENSLVDETQMLVLYSTLAAEGVLDSLARPDVNMVIGSIDADVRRRKNSAKVLRGRARDILEDRDAPTNRGMNWSDRAGVARALNEAAEVVDMVVGR